MKQRIFKLTILSVLTVFSLGTSKAQMYDMIALSNAIDYLNHEWNASSANLANGSCSSFYITPPTWQNHGANVGIPYLWGGFSSLAQFDAGIAAGRKSGDSESVTSGGGVPSSCAVGVDCSGFISRCWGETRLSTRTIPNRTVARNYANLEVSDVSNKFGVHARLVTNPQANGTKVMTEASGEADRVRYLLYGALQESGYSGRRHVEHIYCNTEAKMGAMDVNTLARVTIFSRKNLDQHFKTATKLYVTHKAEIQEAILADTETDQKLMTQFNGVKNKALGYASASFLQKKSASISQQDLAELAKFLEALQQKVTTRSLKSGIQEILNRLELLEGKSFQAALIAFDKGRRSTAAIYAARMETGESLFTYSLANSKQTVSSLNYQLQEDSDVVVTLYNAMGQEVKSYLDGRQAKGTQQLSIDKYGLPPGIYTLAFTIRNGDQVQFGAEKLLVLN